MAIGVLSGPILRRVDKDSVCVWLATQEACTLRVVVLDKQNTELGRSDVLAIDAQRVKVGERLYVYLLQARPADRTQFPADQILYYRIEQLAAGETNALFGADELKALTYGAHPLPSFFISRELKTILHGSCRKPHGGFDSITNQIEPDALGYGDALLQATNDAIENRPALLVLTGDQIYADDVALSLAAELRARASALLGASETLPAMPSGVDCTAIALHGRKKILKDCQSGLTSSASENHLLGLSEFAAMYLYVFGNAQAWAPVWNWEELKRRGVADEAGARRAFDDQLAKLQQFHADLTKVRRLLANIPTYMLFDDHDVTDDWNITGQWYENVKQSLLGRRVVTNALAAYWAFQAWGNDPARFDQDFRTRMAAYFENIAANAPIDDALIEALWRHPDWGFSVACHPPILALNSRTHRHFDKKDKPARLLNGEALEWLQREWTELKTRANPGGAVAPIFIATTPVAGYPTVKWFQRLSIWVLQGIDRLLSFFIPWRVKNPKNSITSQGVNALDAESWSSNTKGFLNFLDQLSDTRHLGLSQCVFLSGDVHYAFTAQATFTRGDRRLDMLQLTSSSLCNEPGALQAKVLKATSKRAHKDIETSKWSIFKNRRWQFVTTLLAPRDGGERVRSRCNLGLIKFNQGRVVAHLLCTRDGQIEFTVT